MISFKKVLPAITFAFGVTFVIPAFSQTAIPTGLSSLPAATAINDTDTFPLCQNGIPSCSLTLYSWANASMSQIDSYLASKSMTLTNKVISGGSNTLTNIPAANLNGIISSGNLPTITAGMLAVGAAASNLGFTPLNPTNNLSELSSAFSARANLGLGSLATLSSLPTTSLTGTLQASQFPALTGDITTVAGNFATTLATVNAVPGSTTCSSVTTNAKGLVTSNSNGACGASYTAGTGLQLVGSQFSVPSAGITSGLLASGVAAANLGFTPLNPANNLSDVALASTARTNLGLGSLATLSSLPTTSLTGTLQAAQFPALTGAVTTTAGSLATTLAAGQAAANLGFTPLRPSNNLSDVVSAATSRTNLGLGSLATLSALPAPTASVLGGAFSSTAAAHNFATGLNTSGALTYAQPDFTDLSGSASVTQLTSALTTPPPIGATTANTGAFSTVMTGSATANPIPSGDGQLLGVTNVINSGALTNNSGIGVYIKNSLASVGPGFSQNVVLNYGYGNSNVNSAWTWGLNPVLFDTAGVTSAALVNEFDFNVSNAGTIVYGLLLQGASTVQPTGIHPAIEVAPLDIQHNPSTESWSYGIETLAGAAAVGAYFGQLTPSSSSSASQPVQFGYSTASVMSMSESSTGILGISPVNVAGATTGIQTFNNGSSTANTASELAMSTLDGSGVIEEIEVGSSLARLTLANLGSAGGIQLSPGSGSFFMDGNTAVSCAAGTVSLSTLVIYKGVATHC